MAYLLVEAGVEDVDVLQAALLHDTVEDTNTSPQELQDVFGPRVAGLVAEVGVAAGEMSKIRCSYFSWVGHTKTSVPIMRCSEKR